ncbi:hypothetical protein BST81_15220 [Leptolyngbya sp. 'hensonii']|uniref:DUF1501 domain-containing protein n=1 Tax=Leptolyngbya sp. 'hensonii' TaxID=1922337 RepID=UPI00094F7835|nr:DUF1501 domain-containing protein [Leptolyngbya sp. 'hensonii']OLP17668.1 hypothetical protein BST81_15220 [Leptolyngbya sp. 'hensonii']
MHRRQFLQQTTLGATATIVTVGVQGWAYRSPAQTAKPKRLIVVFLRGAVDGLSVVVPYRETAYYEARPRIALPRPGGEGSILPLDKRFGLHPALRSLFPLWQQRSLAFVQACGSPDATRSHFEAQDYMETGTPGIKTTRDGWMNRLMATLPGRSPVRAVNVGSTTPRILSGPMTVASLPTGRNATRLTPLDRSQIRTAFDRLYNGKDTLSQAYQEGQLARQEILKELQADMQMADNGAPGAAGLAGDARRLARLMVRDPQVQLGFLAVGGWDTHVNQGSSKGQLATRLNWLAQGLATLVEELKPIYGETVILVMSEFGRTLRENGNGGTDHGHGNVLWAMGGPIKGGQVYGQWPGLATAQLYEGRDLAITTDFRSVLSPLLQNHLGLDQAQLAQVFPKYGFDQSVKIM